MKRKSGNGSIPGCRLRPAEICGRLLIDDLRFVEIEAKRRLASEEAEDLHKYLIGRKGVRHLKRRSFFDQFLDTPELDLLRLGVSLRLRYKGDGSNVYLQYKGPGFHRLGLLFRSEFSSGRLEHVVLEESHHDSVHFRDTSVREILDRKVDPVMAAVMRRHLGRKVISRISTGPIICLYQKDKFSVKLGDAVLEPSIDRLFAFDIHNPGLHAMSTFWEYENEIKAKGEDFLAKLDHVDELHDFDSALAKRFDLPVERLDKYHRCAAFFLRLRRRK